jgi:hypothetical protein
MMIYPRRAAHLVKGAIDKIAQQPHKFQPNGNGVFVCLFVCLSHEARPPHAYRTTTLTKQKHNLNNTDKQMNTSNNMSNAK